ncbi:MAG: YdcF family protein [Clostridia bacterium]|nr:YdcF family protein [Clostridia bacterium]
MTYPFDCISSFIFVETPLEKADVLLIPGSYERGLMEKAAELYHNGLAPLILPSGAHTNASMELSECEFLRQIGLSLGVPDQAILQENQARNTFENAIFSLQVLEKKQSDIKKAIIVCKGYHSRRALMTFQTEFQSNIKFMAAPIIDESGITKNNWYLNDAGIQTVMGEVIKIGSYFGEEIPLLYEKYSIF